MVILALTVLPQLSSPSQPAQSRQQLTPSQKLLDEYLAAANQIQDPESQAAAIAFLSKSYADQGQIERARSLMTQSLRLFGGRETSLIGTLSGAENSVAPGY